MFFKINFNFQALAKYTLLITNGINMHNALNYHLLLDLTLSLCRHVMVTFSSQFEVEDMP